MTWDRTDHATTAGLGSEPGSVLGSSGDTSRFQGGTWGHKRWLLPPATCQLVYF